MKHELTKNKTPAWLRATNGIDLNFDSSEPNAFASGNEQGERNVRKARGERRRLKWGVHLNSRAIMLDLLCLRGRGKKFVAEIAIDHCQRQKNGMN